MTRDELRARAAALPGKPGVYLMKDADGEEIYVGKAKRLRDRVRTYFEPSGPTDDKTMALVAEVDDFDWIECSSEVEALLLESRLIKDLQPRYNINLKSGTGYPLVEITWGEDFPRALVTRERTEKKSKYHGPFVDSTGLRAAVRILQRVFRFRSCSREIRAADPKLRFNRPCLNHHIGRCTAPCAGRVRKREYRDQVRRLSMFLAGRTGDVIDRLEKSMKAASDKLDYERAAEYRDEVEALRSLDLRGDLSDGIEPDVPMLDPETGVRKLAGALGLEDGARIIEGVDIANLGPEDKVGSVVTFTDGTPELGGYRRFRVKTVAGADDYASMREVLSRRYGRLVREGSALPDVVLVDGGPGQLAVAAEVMRELGLDGGRPVVTAIAKKEEIVRTLARPEGLKLSRRNEGLRLLQFIRDEAHRFAQHYHHILRRKRVLQEDD
jgi:excinuclease ABC subunit C